MGRMKWLTEGGFSNPPICRGEACLAHIPNLHYSRKSELLPGSWGVA